VKVLLELKPELLHAEVVTFSGPSTPFFIAVASANTAVITYLADTYPILSTVISGFNLGWLPLHRVCADDWIWQSTIKLILDKYPQAAQKVDNYGRTPLALAAVRRRFDDVLIRVLVEAYPHALKIADNNGKYPLDHDQKTSLVVAKRARMRY
jgi:hypothetical protein